MSDQEKKDDKANKDDHLDPQFVEFKQKTKLYKLYERMSKPEQIWSDKVLSDLSANLGVAFDLVARALQDPEQRKEILKKMNRKDDTES